MQSKSVVQQKKTIGVKNDPPVYKKKSFKSVMSNYGVLYLMMLIGVVYFFVFKYATLSGLIIAFKKFSFKKGIWGSEWVGVKNFIKVFGKNPDLPKIFLNTLEISFCKLLIGFPAPIILALLLNEVQKSWFKRVVQSVLYLPHFLSWVIMAGICTNMFSITTGALPLFLARFGIEMPSLMGDPKYFRTMLYLTDVWKNVGWGTIIYMAAITGIDPQLYEAATIDGCNHFQQVLYVTIPCISTTMVTLLVLNIGSVMNAGFDQIFNLSTDVTRSVSDIIDTYVYRLGMQSYKYEYATIIGMTKSVINAVLLFTANFVTGKLTDNSPL